MFSASAPSLLDVRNAPPVYGITESAAVGPQAEPFASMKYGGAATLIPESPEQGINGRSLKRLFPKVDCNILQI